MLHLAYTIIKSTKFKKNYFQQIITLRNAVIRDISYPSLYTSAIYKHKIN